MFLFLLACSSSEPSLSSSVSQPKKTEDIPLRSEAELREEASQMIAEFAGILKPKLKAALTEKGPIHAVEICAEEAPKIAAELSSKGDWSIKRVSLKNRNTAAAPDAWEKEVLQRWEQEQASKAAVYSETVDGRFRMMKIQTIEPVCLSCHGEQLAEPLKRKLTELYPLDKATGYKLGDVRGAFSVQQK